MLVRPFRLLVVPVTAAVLVLGAAPALAHVTVHADNPTRGASDAVLSFRTPNESDKASTTSLLVAFPTATPLLDVLVARIPGWTAKVTMTKLAKPVQTDDGAVTEVVSRVTWTGGRIPVGGYQDFDVAVGQLPDAASVTFKAVQTYSDGSVVRWIQTAAPGGTAPDKPAPVLTLQAAGAVGAPEPAPSDLASSAGASPATAMPMDVTDSAGSGDGGSGRGIAIAALVISLLAAAAAGFGLLRPRGPERPPATP